MTLRYAAMVTKLRPRPFPQQNVPAAYLRSILKLLWTDVSTIINDDTKKYHE